MAYRHRCGPQRTACRRCHARKVKCNSTFGQPCTGCLAAGVECVAHEKRRRNRGPPRDLSAALPGLLPAQRSEHISSQSSQDADHERTEGWVDSPADILLSPMEPIVETEAGILVEEGDEVGQAAAALSSLQDSGVQRHLVEMLSQDDIDRRVIQKGVRVVYVGQEFSNINYLIRHRARNEAAHHFPANQISRQYTSHHLDRIPKEAFHLPPSTVVDDLLENYFRLVNPGFPILDQEVFMRQYRSRDPQDPPSLLVLQAVLMVGAHVSRDYPDRDELKSAFFRRAKMLFDARFEWNRDVIVQAALLLTWHSEGVEDVGANSYYWMSVAVRTAFGLGMHRDCGPSTLVPQDRRIWRRLWWILVQFDVLVTLSYGRPQAINLDDADVPLLTTQDFDGLRDNVDAEFVMHHSSLCIVISNMLREVFGLRISSERRAAAVRQADRQLAHWLTNLPPDLRPGSSGTRVNTWPASLHITYNNFLILLHRPAPNLATARAVKTEDIEICTSAASSLVTLFETLSHRNELRCLNVFAVNSLFTTLIQLSAEMRIKNPLLSANATTKFDTALEVLRALSNFWLNARILLRLFEDSSERLQQELRIGKHRAETRRNSHSTPAADAATGVNSGFELDEWTGMDDITLADSAQIPLEGAGGQIDWTYLYWENSGFNPLSPFGDLGLYQLSTNMN